MKKKILISTGGSGGHVIPATIFYEQFKDEFIAVCDMYLYYFKIFGIDKYEMRLSLHDPEKLGKKYTAFHTKK